VQSPEAMGQAAAYEASVEFDFDALQQVGTSNNFGLREAAGTGSC
jgi:hypothetical protein